MSLSVFITIQRIYLCFKCFLLLLTEKVLSMQYLHNRGMKGHRKSILSRKARFTGYNSEVDSVLVKLAMMTDCFFSNQDHEIKIKRFVCVKQIKFSFFSHS